MLLRKRSDSVKAAAALSFPPKVSEPNEKSRCSLELKRKLERVWKEAVNILSFPTCRVSALFGLRYRLSFFSSPNFFLPVLLFSELASFIYKEEEKKEAVYETLTTDLV